jgi:ubiquinone biosynthesis protein
MIFEDGFVHADLHPGNILLTADDRVVLIDLGMVSEIPADLLRPWVETFVALSSRDGALAARLFYGYAPSVGGTDYAAFERDVVSFLDQLYGKRLGEVEVSVAVSGMMNVLRKHRVQIDPSFTVVNIAAGGRGARQTARPSHRFGAARPALLTRAMLTSPSRVRRCARAGSRRARRRLTSTARVRHSNVVVGAELRRAPPSSRSSRSLHSIRKRPPQGSSVRTSRSSCFRGPAG